MLKLLFSRRKSNKAKYSSDTWENNGSIKLSRESEHFLNIFPELVWKHIIAHLDLNALKNLSNASPFFRNLLLRKRVEFLFKDVFETVAPRLLGNNHGNNSTSRLLGNRWTNQKQVQLLVFNCRLVCVAWNKSICNLAQEVPPNWNWDTGNRDKYAVFKFITESYEFNSEDKIGAFHRKFSTPPYETSFIETINPFFGKTVLVSVPPLSFIHCRLENPFHEGFGILLYFFGKFVNNCQIHLSIPMSDPHFESEHTCSYLMDILGLLPNLRHLSLVNYNNFIADQINNTEPATLKRLQSISMHSVCGTLCNKIVRSNLQISRLIIEQSEHNMQNAGYLLHSFENLYHLELIWCNWNEINGLKNFDNNCWKLKSLKLKYYVVVNGEYPEWIEVFNILSTKFGKNLEELELAIPEITDELQKSKLVDDMLEYRLCLPKIKKFDLTVKNDVTFDFLLGVSETLESLRITSLTARQKGKKSKILLKAKQKETIQILSCHDKLYRSNIWTMLPKLKSVQLCDGLNFSWSYNRYDWRKKQKTRNFFKR